MSREVLAFVLLLAPLLWVTFRGKEAWPFSHYPMFSQLSSIGEVEVLRVALETCEGEVVWWRSEFYRYPEIVGRALKRLDYFESEGDKVKIMASMERRRLMAEIARLIDAEQENLRHYRAFHIIRRTVEPDEGGSFRIEDQAIIRIPLAQ